MEDELEAYLDTVQKSLDTQGVASLQPLAPPTRICQSRTPNPRIVGCGGKIHWAYPCLRLSLRHCLLNLRLQRT